MLKICIARVHRGRIGNSMYGWSVFGPNLPFWRRHVWYLWPLGFRDQPAPPPAEQPRPILTTNIPLAPGFELQIIRERSSSPEAA